MAIDREIADELKKGVESEAFILPPAEMTPPDVSGLGGVAPVIAAPWTVPPPTAEQPRQGWDAQAAQAAPPPAFAPPAFATPPAPPGPYPHLSWDGRQWVTVPVPVPAPPAALPTAPPPAPPPAPQVLAVFHMGAAGDIKVPFEGAEPCRGALFLYRRADVPRPYDYAPPHGPVTVSVPGRVPPALYVSAGLSVRIGPYEVTVFVAAQDPSAGG